jgi:hypothetical protein
VPSVMGLLEERELAARQRVEELREEADRILAVLRDAEATWERFVIARETVGEVLAEPHGQEAAASDGDAQAESSVSRPVIEAVPGSVVPVRRDGLEVSVLAPDYQRIMNILADHERDGGEAMGCQQIAAMLGLETVPAKVEGVRSKAKRLVDRGWLVEKVPGRFSVAAARGGVS